MRRSSETNINTTDYWNGCYAAEQASGKERVDPVRMAALQRWIDVREEEIGRRAAVLDVGCGLGDVARKLLPDGVRYHGVDIAEQAIEHCRNSIRGATFSTGHAEALPVEGERFDVVWIGETIEHCNDPERVVAEAARVCTEHGFVVISTPYRGRNRSPEHVWEFEPADVVRWAAKVGELVFLDCKLLGSWETMFAVMRRAQRVTPS